VETKAKQLFEKSPFLRKVSALTQHQLTNIDSYLQCLLKSDSSLLKKTHYFHNRYENLYLKDHDLKDLNQLVEETVAQCAGLLDTNKESLSISYWFNLMNPGHITDWHTHDDLDELISGVIYLNVPEYSGDLVLRMPSEDIVLPPKTGHYVFFSPETPHSVTENKSSQHRLSIGFNIGLKSGLQYSQ
jgi:hypothetical protein